MQSTGDVIFSSSAQKSAQTREMSACGIHHIFHTDSAT